MSRQTERISKMEGYLDEGKKAVKALEKALEGYEAAFRNINRLEKYYTSDLWLKDFEDDEAGKLPKGLKRGVLSEDSVYDFLNQDRDLIIRMDKLIKAYLKEHEDAK